jgi:hypothetical protein
MIASSAAFGLMALLFFGFAFTEAAGAFVALSWALSTILLANALFFAAMAVAVRLAAGRTRRGWK